MPKNQSSAPVALSDADWNRLVSQYLAAAVHKPLAATASWEQDFKREVDEVVDVFTDRTSAAVDWQKRLTSILRPYNQTWVNGEFPTLVAKLPPRRSPSPPRLPVSADSMSRHDVR